MSGPAWFLRLRDTAPNWAERYATIDAALTEGLLDGVTLAEYLAETTPAARAQAVLDALADPVTVRVYNGDGSIMGQGTMQAPWATAAAGVITLAEVTQFIVTQSGAPDPTSWYLRFESGTRWVRGSFGLVGSLAACTWSLPTWEAGQNGTIGTVTIGVPSGSAPSLVGAPSALSFTEGVGGTYDFSEYANDPDGDELTFSLSSGWANGYSITSSGLLTIGTVSQVVTIRVMDSGGLSSDWQVTVTVSAPSEHSYPRIAAGQIGGFSTTWVAARWNTVGKYQLAFLGGNRWWSAGGYNMSGLASYLKSANPSIKLFKYTNVVETYYNDPAWSVVWNKYAAEDGAAGVGDWWLRDAAGNQIVGFSSTQRRVNFTSLVMPDANGWRVPEWFARFWYNSAGELSGLTGQGIKDGPWDGVYEDNQYIDRAFTVTGDYDEDGVNESGTDPEIVNLVVEGHVAYHDAWFAIAPSLLFGANQSAYLHPTEGTYDSRLTAINDAGWMEDHSKMDYYFGFATMMAKYRDGLSWLSGPKYGCFNAHLFRYTGWLGWTEERANRYFLCATLLDDGWYMPTSTDNGYDEVVWCDEFDHNLGQPIGTTAGAVQTSAWSLGVFRREFDNGIVLINPRGNGDRTVTLPSAGTGYEWRRLTTTAWTSGTVLTNASINTGAAQSASLTINDGTGLILRRVVA